MSDFLERGLRLPDMRPPQLPRLTWLQATARLVGRQASAELFGAPGYSLTLARPKAFGFACSPREFRPADAAVGRSTAAGRFVIAGSVVDVGSSGDIWDRPCPTRRFAVDLHRFVWLPDLMASGDRAPREALRLILAWAEIFGSWNAFSWSRETLPRRVINLACAARRIGASSSEADRARLADLLARQARHLGRLRPGASAGEIACARTLAGATLSGPAGRSLLAQGLSSLKRALAVAVLADGCHVSRSPEAGLELLFDLLTLDDALLQIGHEPPQELGRSIDRLTAGLRTLTLPDGRLAAFQGGEMLTAPRVAAARAHDDTGTPAAAERLLAGGYERLDGQMMHIILDAAAPAAGAAPLTACAQPGAIEIVCGRDRLITNSGWSERACDRQGFRLTPAGSTLSLGEGSIGDILSGRSEKVLGPRLSLPPMNVTVRREAGEGAVLVETGHDGWVPQFGLRHERRLYLDQRLDEVRGEERLVPTDRPVEALAAPYAVRFYLQPGATASMARDRRSVILRGESGRGWFFRSDATDVAIEPSACFENGLTRRSVQIVLRGSARTDAESRIRWKLEPAGATESQI